MELSLISRTVNKMSKKNKNETVVVNELPQTEPGTLTAQEAFKVAQQELKRLSGEMKNLRHQYNRQKMALEKLRIAVITERLRAAGETL